MNYQKDVSNFMILGEQKIASDLNLKNEQNSQRNCWTNFGCDKNAPYPDFGNTIKTKSVFLGFCQVDCWSQVRNSVGSKINQKNN